MTRPCPQLRTDKSIEEVARLVEESSLGTVGARQLRDRAVGTGTSTAATIRARAYFASSVTGRAWWQANQHNAGALLRKAHELAICGDLEISDVLTRLAADQQSSAHPDSTDAAAPGRGPDFELSCHSQPAPAPQRVTADWRTFEAFYHREVGPLSRILCERADLPQTLGRELISHAMVKAFDDWEHLAAAGNPGEWVLGCALQLHRSPAAAR